ncbi:acyloxyacyl hydrolase [Rhodoferax sp.]|uniref:acyloxyacyl hydrolase n=1 Tax=Rhodoferax sp. TaxID=50421 RepID=UPI0025F99FFD|nr:acyloxyacyl hydrolase [Rhodoferax sp.]
MRFIHLRHLLTCLALTAAHGAAQALDAASLELAVGEKVQMVRVGAQWDWERRWFQSNGTHLGGYWDLSLAQWRGTHYQNIEGKTQDITSIGLTPVLRFQQDSKKGFYAEARIGIHLLSELYDNDNNHLSTSFQFGDEVGVGYVFNNKLDIGLKLQHFSNGGIKKPNDGIDFTSIRVRYIF